MKKKVRNNGIKSLFVILLISVIMALAGCSNYTEEDDASASVASTVAPADDTGTEEADAFTFHFRSEKLLNDHYEKHGAEMGFASPEEYEKAASAVVNDPESLHKLEKDDGDDVYYLEKTNEFVVVSTDGYIRTYFLPDAGIAYYNKQ